MTPEDSATPIPSVASDRPPPARRRRAPGWTFATLLLSVSLCSHALAADELQQTSESGVMWLISPLVGYNRNEMASRDRRGKTVILKETAPEYGLFALAAHPRFAINDFLFFTEGGGKSDVMGNFFHANLYGDPAAYATWNVGAGHLYHKIEPPKQDIDVNVFIAKVGPMLRYKPWGLSLNPYVGHAWERVGTRRSTMEDKSYLYGASLDWQWRMVNANIKYYTQDSRKGNKNYHNFHLRLSTGITRNIGLALRIDYMEQLTGDNTSILVGPVFRF